ncbi:MAG TPA: hypothetical protein VF486_19765 [Actinomycetes bacterium]
MRSSRIPDPGSLIAGVAFAGIGLIFLVGDVELADRVRWVWPIALVGLGAGLLAAVLRRPAGETADGPTATTTSGREVALPRPEPSSAPEPAAAAALPYELQDPAPGSAGEPDAAEEGPAAGDPPEGRERS